MTGKPEVIPSRLEEMRCYGAVVRRMDAKPYDKTTK